MNRFLSSIDSGWVFQLIIVAMTLSFAAPDGPTNYITLSSSSKKSGGRPAVRVCIPAREGELRGSVRPNFILAGTLELAARTIAFAISRFTKRKYFGYLPSLKGVTPQGPIVSGPS